MYNSHFKPPKAHPSILQRSPSPPDAYVEPLSPATIKPHPIEPNFNYPPLHANFFSGHNHANASQSDVSQHGKRGHQRVPSNIDTLADAALAVGPGESSDHRPYQYQPGPDQHSLVYEKTRGTYNGEPPHKRARSEAYPHAGPPLPYARPATSYYGWPAQQQPLTYSLPTPSYETRVEDAALLLNFSTAANWPPQLPLPPQHAFPAPAFPYANVPLQGYQQALHAQDQRLLPAFDPVPQQYQHFQARTLPSPQRTSDGKGPTPEATGEHVVKPEPYLQTRAPQQIHTPPEEMEPVQQNPLTAPASKAKGRSGQRKPRSAAKKPATEKPASRRTIGVKKKRTVPKTKKGAQAEPDKGARRRLSTGDIADQREHTPISKARSVSVPPELQMIIRPASAKSRRNQKMKAETVCEGCHQQRLSHSVAAQLDEWVSCNGCKNWFHLDCAGFKKIHEVRDVDKFFCKTCETTHGKTTYVRKSKRAHASVDYAELQKGVLKTSEESNEHHYIQPIKDGTFTFDPEFFPRIRPELLTRDFFEKTGAFVEPICIPAEWNTRPWANALFDEATEPEEEMGETTIMSHDFEYDCEPDEGQDSLDMIMPKRLTVRKVCNLVGPETPIDVIDVKTQNSGAKWNLARWAEYYESESDDKEIRNVISLEVSQTKLGRLLRRPKVVRDIDLQDEVWPKDDSERGKFPKVQYYCLMSIADSYTDFHIDFGGSSVYYHLIKGKKTFFFIPPKAKHLKAYEEWNDNPQQNFTFLPHITKECYRVDLSEGDTMLIPSGWIHAVWTPETSLVIGGNFLNRMSFKNQFRVVDIEKNNETPQKFRYPYFQKIMWYTLVRYLQDDPLPEEVKAILLAGQRFERAQPVWQEYDDIEQETSMQNARYYSQAEIDGLPELTSFILRTVMMVNGNIEGVTADRMRRVNASIPKGYGEPLELIKHFAMWVAWKRGNEEIPAWAYPEAALPEVKGEAAIKKLSANAIKTVEKKTASKNVDRKSKRRQASATSVSDLPAAQFVGSRDATMHVQSGTLQKFDTKTHHAPSFASPLPSDAASQMLYTQSMHQGDAAVLAYDFSSPASMTPTSMMMSGFQGQHISTPKTSVLGPKRVACDACRRRRIRCKHKDFVIQATSDVHYHQLQDGFQAIGASGTDTGMMIAHEQQSSPSHHDHTYDGAVNGLTNGMHNFDAKSGLAPSTPNGSQMSPGSYADGNIPMTINGVPLFGGDQKKGRSKACGECRKSKRRCIHDENGNVDPVKAAEVPIPRASPSTKKRLSSEEGGVTTPQPEVKKVKKDTAQHGGLRGVLRPINTANIMHSRLMQNGGMLDSKASPQPALPIDPELMSAFSGSASHSPYEPNFEYVPVERPMLTTLPSLEQIATEVLDMSGGEGEDESDVALATALQRELAPLDQSVVDDASLAGNDNPVQVMVDPQLQDMTAIKVTDSIERRDSLTNMPSTDMVAEDNTQQTATSDDHAVAAELAIAKLGSES